MEAASAQAVGRAALWAPSGAGTGDSAWLITEIRTAEATTECAPEIEKLNPVAIGRTHLRRRNSTSSKAQHGRREDILPIEFAKEFAKNRGIKCQLYKNAHARPDQDLIWKRNSYGSCV